MKGGIRMLNEINLSLQMKLIEEFAKFAKSQCVDEEACCYVIHLKDSIRGALLP